MHLLECNPGHIFHTKLQCAWNITGSNLVHQGEKVLMSSFYFHVHTCIGSGPSTSLRTVSIRPASTDLFRLSAPSSCWKDPRNIIIQKYKTTYYSVIAIIHPPGPLAWPSLGRKKNSPKSWFLLAVKPLIDQNGNQVLSLPSAENEIK